MERDASIKATAALYAVVRGAAPNYRELLELVNLCHKMAVAYLRVKISCSRFDPTRSGESVEDFAFDSIAALFARDEAGSFTAIRSFIRGIGPVEQMSVEELLGAIRRLVCGAVNQNIFRSYQTSDPSLAKILRNIKLALKTHPTVRALETVGGIFVAPRNANDLRDHLPVIASEILSPEFFDRISAGSKLKDMLSIIGNILTEQTTYRRTLSLLEVGLHIRSAYQSDLHIETSDEPRWEISDEEMLKMIDATIDRVRKTTGAKYVNKAKITLEELRAHLSAVRKILLQEFSTSNDDSESFYNILKSRLPGVDARQYSRKHRPILEYLVKVATINLREQVRKELL